MPYLRIATDNPFGAMPYDEIKRITPYVKDASAGAIHRGDFVVLEADGGVAVAAAASTNLLGVAAGYSAASTLDQYFMVYDHPDQLFAIQDDSAGTEVNEASIGFNFDILATTGDTNTLQSAMELNSDGQATSATAQLRLIQLHPIENASFATGTGQQRKWVVKINEHLYYDRATGI